MGFSSALQGRAAQIALLTRQDAELRLLETMKRCLLQKAKCDKEYSVALIAVNQQGLKIDRADELQGSHITKAWRTIMDEIEQTAKQLKSNAELLDTLCQEKLTQLYQDKRKARKAYQEEHSRIATQFNQLTEEVTRKKSEYQKHMEHYKMLRSRFEDHYIKSGRGGRKLDDVRDKYQKACRKLHLAHNEYVLLISEATEVEKDFRTILLPGLLEHQQCLQEGFILTWRNIIQEAAQCGDFTSDKFREIQNHIESTIQSVIPTEEYREFTEKHKTSPAVPIIFQFDETLIEDSLGKLQPNTLTVDNLTVDWLRTRLNELETSVKQCQDNQNKLISDENITGNQSLPIANGINNGLGKDNKHSKDFNALRCQGRQMIKLAEIIKTALNDVGCEELPSGCDDLSVEQNFIENNVNTDQPSTPTTSYIMQKGAEVISLIKAPFKRKSGAPTPEQRTPRHQRRLSSPSRSLSIGSSVNSLGLKFNNDETTDDANLAVNIDDNNLDTNSLLCENNIIAIEINSELTNFEEQINIINIDLLSEGKSDSQNYLLLNVDAYQEDITSSIDAHLDSIDQINKHLDERYLHSDEITSNLNATSKNNIIEKEIVPPGKSLRQKIKQKIKNGRFIKTDSEKNRLIEFGLEKENGKKEIKNENKNVDKKKLLLDTTKTKGQIGLEENLENEIKDLEKLIENTDNEIKKTSNNKTKKTKTIKCNSANDETIKDDDLKKNNESSTQKLDIKQKFSNRSVNALMSSWRERKNNKNPTIVSVETNLNETLLSRNVEKIKLENENECESYLKQDNCLVTESKNSNNILEQPTETNAEILPALYLQIDENFDLPSTSDHELSTINNKEHKNISTKIKENFKLKLKFNLKMKNKKNSVCKNCSKKLHPSPTVLDFEKEFHTEKLFEKDLEFCLCDSNDDFLSIKNHTYCESEGVSIWYFGIT